MNLHDLEQQTGVIDRAIQMALREVDSRQLAIALIPRTETEREPIFRNMSKRAVVVLKEEITSLESSGTPRTLSDRMLNSFLNRVRVFIGYVEENISSTPGELPDPSWNSPAELSDFMVSLKRFTNANGALALEPLVKNAELSPLLKQGIEMYIDGWEPAMAREILVSLQESLIQAFSRDLSIQLEGVLALYTNDIPQVIEKRLKNMIPPDISHNFNTPALEPGK